MTTTMTTTCRKCGSAMSKGIAFVPTLISSLDGLGATVSHGNAAVKHCLKCSKCGHSYIPAKG